jgi:hypothetical protein
MGVVGFVSLMRAGQARLIEGKYVILRGDGKERGISFFAGMGTGPQGQHMVRWVVRLEDAQWLSEEEADRLGSALRGPFTYDGVRYYDIRVRSVKEVQEGSTR